MVRDPEVDRLYHACHTLDGERTAPLLVLLLATVVLLSAAPAFGEPKYTGAALEWELLEPLPSEVSAGSSFKVVLNFKNEGTVDLTGRNKTKVEISIRGDPLDSQELQLGKNKSQDVTFDVRIEEEGTFQLKLNAYYGSNIVNLHDQSGDRNVVVGNITSKYVEEPINLVPIIGAVVVVVLVVLGYYLYTQRRKRVEEAQKVVEEARRKEVIRKKEEEIAKKIEVRQVVGKHPRDYYVLRRQKYAVMRPGGMTSSGLTILRHDKSKAEREEEKRIECPKCGTHLESEDAECPRCTATETIEEVRHNIRSYKSRFEVDFADAEALLRKSEHRLNWSDYTMALSLANRAASKTEEIWDAAEKGEALESTVVEYTDVKGPTIDAEVIGMEGVETPAAPADAGPVDEAELVQEEETAGEPCPECGTPTIDGECLICGFSDNLDSCWTFIERGELDGADMSEVKNLCRQANNAHERGNDELAIRYLRRALRMSEEQYHDHARSKTEGIIQFTKTMVDQVKGMGEDVGPADLMISKADEALATGQYGAARSMAAKADGYIKQMREDSYRKQIGELMPAVEAAAESNDQVQQLLAKARKLIKANELEGAVDLLEAARSKI